MPQKWSYTTLPPKWTYLQNHANTVVLQNYATQVDLRNHATQVDLRDHATQVDLRKHATKWTYHATKVDLQNHATDKVMAFDTGGHPVHQDPRSGTTALRKKNLASATPLKGQYWSNSSNGFCIPKVIRFPSFRNASRNLVRLL